MQQQDEITLIDLFGILAKHKKVFLVIFSIVVLIGGAITISKPLNYKYTQAIKLASYTSNSMSESYFFDADTVIANLNSIYLPIVIDQKNQLSSDGFKFSANNINFGKIGNGMLVLSAKAKLVDKEKYKELFTDLLNAIKQDTTPRRQEQTEYLTSYLAVLQNQLKKQELNNKNLQNIIVGKDNSSALQMTQKLAIITSVQTTYIDLIKQIQQTKQELRMLKKTAFASGFIVSDKAIEMSKFMLLTLIFILALIVSSFSVFIIDFWGKMGKANVS